MLPKQLLLLCFAVATAKSQNNNENDNAPLTFSNSFSTLSSVATTDFTGSQYTYITATDQSSRETSTSTETGNSTVTSTGTDSQSRRTSTTQQLTVIGAASPTTNETSSSPTSSAAQPTNTIPCNGFPEFCNRKYSNITHVAAHNSAFNIPNNVGSNQYYDTAVQLNDGIRMIQGQTHFVNDTMYNCHTSCDLLNAGTWQSQLEVITNWVQTHPYDVVTILVGNDDLVRVDKYVPAVEASGILPYLYTPEFVPQRREQWPTLGEMILSGKRVVLFMDYFANQTAVPYILDEFTHMWETPFSPTDQNFPCTVERPPWLAENRTKAQTEWMYMANHNLNTAIDIGGLGGALGGSGGGPLLVPNVAEINQTNGQFDTFGQLEAMRLNCTGEWEHPPNFLLVDYYNYGDPRPGSVFEVAARANEVQYTRECCGAQTSAAPNAVKGSSFAFVVASVFTVLFVWT